MQIQNTATLKTPTKKMRAEYNVFVGNFCEHLRKRNLKRKKEEKIEYYVPFVRGKKTELVPDGNCYPCNACDDANYNQGCPHVAGCTAITFHGLLLLKGMSGQDAQILLTGLTASKGNSK